MPINRKLDAGYYAIFVVGVVVFVTTVIAVWQQFSPVPYGDSWDGTIGFYLRALQNPSQAFFEQHNEHRLVVSRLIFFSDVRYFGGRNVLSLIANLVFASFFAITFYRVAAHHRANLSTAARFGLAGAALALTFSWIQSENFTWGFQSQWFAVYLFALLAFHSVDLAAEAETRREPAKASAWLVAALASSVAAAFSMSSGLLVLPVLLVQAIYLRFRVRRILVIAAIAIVVWIVYFAGWHATSGDGSLTSGLRHHPVDTFRYVLLFLGSPARNTLLGLSGTYLCGAVALAATVAYCLSALRARPGQICALSLLTFALFIVGDALVTANGRLWLGLGSALASRYTTASLAAWLAMGLFALLNTAAGTRRYAVLLFALAATLLVVDGQRQVRRYDHNQRYGRLVAGLALRAHVYDAPLMTAVYPSPERLLPTVKEAEAARISIFAPSQPDYPTPPSRVIATLPCEGFTDVITGTSAPGIYRATGWMYDAANSSVPRTIVVADADGAPLGMGVSGGERADVNTIYGRHARYSEWTAFFRPPAQGEIVVNGRIARDSYCRLRGTSAVPAVLPVAGQ